MKTRRTPGYHRGVRADTRLWLNEVYAAEMRQKAEAERQEREAELAAVLADLEKNKPT